MNGCTLAPDWVVAGQAMTQEAEVVNVIVTVCDGHKAAVTQWLSELGGGCVVAEIGALEQVRDFVTSEMGDVHVPVAATA